MKVINRMDRSPVELIRKKRDGLKLDQGEINSFFNSYLTGSVADYQMSAMLMAVWLRGMSFEETACLTKIMQNSGHTLGWDVDRSLIVDKHSTGGVGDKTSLILLPLCCLEGLLVPMISGRGLGHTGGTLDKLQAIPGMQVRISEDDARATISKYGGAFMGQTEDLAPLDRRLYALRDVTGTVESVPLITASILSKKLAEGIGGLVMDVKYGSGAFMSSLSDAKQLAISLVNVAKECGLNVQGLITDMNSPLGESAGNMLEVIECIDILKGGGPQDTRDLSLELSSEMVRMAKPSESLDTIKKRLQGYLTSGAAFERFCQIVDAQSGDVSFLEQPEKFKKAGLTEAVLAPKSGYISEIDVRKLGMAVVELGGGRKLVDDAIDYSVGLTGLSRAGKKINAGDELAVIHANDQSRLKIATEMVTGAYNISDTCEQQPLVAERIV